MVFKLIESTEINCNDNYEDEAIDLVASWYVSKEKLSKMDKEQKIDIISRLQVE